jgi:hypothetical protein
MSTTLNACPRTWPSGSSSSEKVLERGAALTSRLQSFETELLTQAENLPGLAALNRELVAKGKSSIHRGG